MRGQTTDPDIVNQFAATGVADPAELRKQIADILARGPKPNRKALREPDLYWEEPGLHGSGRQAKLRSPQLASSKIARGRLPMSAPARKTTALPPHPVRRTSTGELAVVGGVILGAGALAWWLTRKPAATKVQGAGPVALPDWCTT
jgi:hypothetical protein